jgi:hypothetical protein
VSSTNRDRYRHERGIIRAKAALAAVLLAIPLGPGLLSCPVVTDPHSRVVTGSITLAGYPAKGIRVRLVTAEAKHGCGADGVEATTDGQGTFRIAHEALHDRLTAAERHVTLCIKEAGTWHASWSRALEDAPPKVSFFCELAPNAAPHCEADIP